MESYKQKLLERKYGKLIHLKPFNDSDLKEHKHEKYKLTPATRRQIADVTDEEGLKRAYEAKYDLYQHYNKLVIAGTKDFPVDHIDDSKLQFDDTLNKLQEVEMQMLTTDLITRSTLLLATLGGSVALPLEKQGKKGNNPYGIAQSKTYGAPVISGNIKSPLLKNKKHS